MNILGDYFVFSVVILLPGVLGGRLTKLASDQTLILSENTLVCCQTGNKARRLMPWLSEEICWQSVVNLNFWICKCTVHKLQKKNWILATTESLRLGKATSGFWIWNMEIIFSLEFSAFIVSLKYVKLCWLTKELANWIMAASNIHEIKHYLYSPMFCRKLQS